MSGNVFLRFQNPSENKLWSEKCVTYLCSLCWYFYLLILFVADLSYFCSNTRSSTVFFPLLLETRPKQTFAQSGSISNFVDVPVKMHLLTGPSLDLLPSAINHGVIHPPLAPLVKWGHCPFHHAASEECGMRQTRHTHTDGNIPPNPAEAAWMEWWWRPDTPLLLFCHL